MRKLGKYSLLCLLFSTLALAQIRQQVETLNNDANVQNVNSQTLAGSYRIRLTLQQMTIKKSTLTLKMCNLHLFHIKKSSKTHRIKFTLKSSTQKACPNDSDKDYIQLLQQITSYQLQGSFVSFLKGKQQIARAQRKSQTPDSLEGNWKLQVINLGMENTNSEIVFNGCNTNSFSYTTSGNKVSIESIGSTRIGCNVDNDRIFANALLRAKTFKLGQVSFQLFDSDGKVCVMGTPYLV